MSKHPADSAIAIVGVGAILPDALSAPAFWENVLAKRYSITDVDPERWSPDLFFDPDPSAPDKTYSKIGGWVRGFEFDWKRFRIPPRVSNAMDEGQHWAVTVSVEALSDAGFPERPIDTDRTSVIMGAAMGGELHYISSLRINFPEYAAELEASAYIVAKPPPEAAGFRASLRAGPTDDESLGVAPTAM